MKLDVTFYAQRVGLFNPPPIDDPNGCWYASAKMIGTYHEGTYFRTRRGVPELTNADGTHQAIGRDWYNVLFKNENLEPLVPPANFDLGYFKDTLEKQGPILFFWWSTNYASKVAYYHASVMIGTSDLAGLRDIIYHDPAVGPDQIMAFSTLQSLREGELGTRQPFAARIKSTIPNKKVENTGAKRA